MNYRLPVLLTALAASCLIGQGCQKEIDQFIPSRILVPMDFSSLVTTPEDTLIYRLDGTIVQKILTPTARQFTFRPDIFEYQTGADCSCDFIEIVIIELKDKRDYIAHQKPTVSQDRLLVSGGAFHIAAYHDGKSLRLKAGKTLPFSIPALSPDPKMELFYGAEEGQKFTWLEADREAGSMTNVQVAERQSDSTFFIGYDCFTDRLAWINVDKLMDEGVKNPVCVSVDTLSDHLNTVVFAVLIDELSILSMNATDDHKYCISHLPVGAKVIFLAVRQLDEEQYELAFHQTNIGGDHLQFLEFESKTLSQIKSVLEGL